MSDIRAFHTFLDKQAGTLLSKAEAMQAKQAINSLRGTNVIYKGKNCKEISRLIVDAQGKVTRQMLGKQPVSISIKEIMKTQRWTSALVGQGMPFARAQAIARGLTRGLSAGAAELPKAEAAAGL
jgi:hypothetical protein